MTKFDPKEYVDLVHKTGRQRKATLGRKCSNVDFIAGAMVVFFHLGIQEQLPALWVLGPSLGEDPIPSEAEK